MEEILFSVITPTYNRDHLLGRAVNSVLGQTFKNFEYIIINDGSKDRTVEVVGSFKDPRIIFESLPENRGVDTALNRALDLARGKYIVFLGDDDDLLPDCLQTLLRLWEEVSDPSVGGVLTRYSIVGSGGKLWGHLEREITLDYEGIIREREAKGDFLNCWKKEVFEKVRFEDGLPGCEFVTWLEIAGKWKFCFKNTATARYYPEERPHLCDFRSRIKNSAGLAKGIETILERNGRDIKRYAPDRYSHYLQAAVLYHLLNGNNKRARELAGLALREGGDRGISAGLFLMSFFGKKINIFLFELREKIKKAI